MHFCQSFPQKLEVDLTTPMLKMIKGEFSTTPQKKGKKISPREISQIVAEIQKMLEEN
jgi:hypothetical protein